MKTIGLIGGMSWESSAEYYRLINQHMKARLGGHRNARSVMVTVCFDEIETLQHAGHWDELGRRMRQAARQAEAGGADFVVLCTNTMHKVAPAIEAALSVPFVHIVDPPARALRRAGVRRAGLLGTRFTMEAAFYRERMASLHGIDVIVPDERDRAVIHDVIYDELCHGVVRDASRDAYRRIIESLEAAGAQGVILGCTEIALLIGPEDSALPVFDTTELHALAAVELAAG
ncbi:aspartate/glutamate racemase family protein [Burkholderia thailandensis]|uniref:aspartate/glutamate racemase family protein n=1 Tax=Burkholderia thailandensis TaxID=57975 RepID=UPI0022AC748A|nr:aspartate/glutamate racemase family protein [Burkholderia thailandensis]MCZ2900808.1 aspartate/glutamate racemase family protein [Burkholderia thailandensis]MDD1480654.1 aspartate/glutamate racemase family protein [Burkholderia thailandensis]MDD1487799.1 aspartate/glutamate racemase family protein [Burkholderia thailandensis]MDD1493721.1 aspartate/glutamate racemase family protein [Burkholderia thailandensis]